MLGWEFPPFISGGLGTACYGLTKAMSRQGTKITFVLPGGNDQTSDFMKILTADGFLNSEEFKNITFRSTHTALNPYASASGVSTSIEKNVETKSGSPIWQTASSGNQKHYGGDVFEKVQKYTSNATQIAATEKFNIIHAHDWMTFPAAIAASEISGKPAVVHVHSTEFDRCGDYVNQAIYDIERYGMHKAHKIIAVSNYTKNIIINRYSVPAEKIKVVYNGVESCGATRNISNKRDKIVLYLGRITFQKGPEYFIAAAKRVLEKMSNVKFVIAGDGDMTHRMIEYAAYLGIGHKVFFTRFLRGQNVERVYRMSDLYVMPSVSEPFGIAALEAMINNVPVILSRQSGIAEAVSNALKVNFWDVDEMADKIAAVLKHQPLRTMLTENGCAEAGGFRWDNSAAKVNEIYRQVLACA
ncbi:MAG: hypothetical protein A2Y10_14425 [Planctomycetes bacterium GWF2_41_51]|nr:MAG: hypothetical protein A2Y10_14425 [Planctomycetes bacterium GWF2_41_51]